MKKITLLAVYLLCATFSVSYAQEWGNIATISETTAGYLCAYDVDGDSDNQIDCNDTMPYVDTSGNISATGSVSATAFYGDGSNLTGISTASALGDLTDVNVASPADGRALVWDNASLKWVQGPALEGCSYSDTIPNLTTSPENGYVATASSYYDANYAPYTGFNGVSGWGGGSAWGTTAQPTVGSPQWLGIEMPSAVQIHTYSIQSTTNADPETIAPKDWTLQGSDDGSSWTTVDTQTNETNWSSGERRVYTLSSPQTYRYFRVHITDNNGNTYHVGISDIDLNVLTCSGADDLGNHTAEQALNMSSNKIINLTDPTDAQDAATKAYVDAATGSSLINGTSSITVANGGSITIDTNGSNRMIVGDTGNVGIGTQSPLGTFHVSGSLIVDAYNSEGNGVFFRPDHIAELNKYNLSILSKDFSNNGASPDGLLISAQDGVGFVTGDNTGETVRMMIKHTGNVGISTTNPQTKLEVNGTISATGVSVTGAVSATAFYGDGSNLTGVAAQLVSLTDVAAASPVSGSILKYVESTGKWTSVAANENTALVAFTVVKTAHQTTSAGGVITWDTEITDTDNAFDLTNNRFVAPVDGTYYFHADILGQNTTTSAVDILLYKNGVSTNLAGYGGANGSVVHRQSTLSGVLTLTAGEYVDIRTPGADYIYGSTAYHTRFSGFLLSGSGGTDGGATVASINNIGDVDTSSSAPTNGEVLSWNGTNWVPSATSVINNINDIGDVSATNPPNGAFLRYDGSEWASVSTSMVVSTTTMVAGWPDAIQCNNGATDFFLYMQNYSPSSDYLEYALPLDNSASRYLVTYNTSTGNYSGQSGLAGYDCVTNTWSISQLYAQGRAFNFIGNNGAAVTLNEIGDVSATAPTDGQTLTWNNAESRWEAADAAAAINALSDIGDVSDTTPADNSFLRYNGTASEWEPVGINEAVSTTTMVAGWPDAIYCSGTSGGALMYNTYIGTSGEYRYEYGANVDHTVKFYSDGSYNTRDSSTLTTSCDGKSISQLYAEGKAFNFIGNNGAAVNLHEIADVSATAPTDGQALTWNNAESRWEAADMVSGLWTASGSDAYYNTGDVGIGTASPAMALHVSSSTNYQGIFINGNVAPNIGFDRDVGSVPEWKAGISGNDGTGFSISKGAANDDKVFIDATGDVGIGTTSPSRTLTVSGTTWTKVLELSSVAGAAVPVSVSTEASAETDPQVGTLGASGQWCTTDGSVVNCNTAAPSGADNLGDHTATQDLDMNGNSITNALNISATGVMWTNKLELEGIAGGNGISQTIAGGSDNLGDHTATQDLDMNGNSITNALNISATGVMWTNKLELEGIAGGNGISQTVAGGSDNLGDHTATEALDMATYDIQSVGNISATSVSTTVLHVTGGTGYDCSSTAHRGRIRVDPNTGFVQVCRWE